MNASEAGGSQPSASLDSGTVVPQSRPAAMRARKARRRLLDMPSQSPMLDVNSLPGPIYEIIFCNMAVDLDEIDVQLLAQLQLDADRTNVELARLVGLSPAATL